MFLARMSTHSISQPVFFSFIQLVFDYFLQIKKELLFSYRFDLFIWKTRSLSLFVIMSVLFLTRASLIYMGKCLNATVKEPMENLKTDW